MRLEPCDEMSKSDGKCPWCGRGVKIIPYCYSKTKIELITTCPWTTCEEKITIIQQTFIEIFGGKR